MGASIVTMLKTDNNAISAIHPVLQQNESHLQLSMYQVLGTIYYVNVSVIQRQTRQSTELERWMD